MLKTPIKHILVFYSQVLKIARLFKHAFGVYKLNIIVLTGLGFLSGVFESIGLAAIIPLFAFVLGDAVDQSNFIANIVHTAFEYLHLDFSIKFLLILVVSLFILKAIALFLGKYFQTRIVSRYEMELRVRLFKTVFEANWPYLSKQKLGNLETLLLTEVGHVSSLLQNFGVAIMTVASLIIYLFITLNLSATISLIALGLGLVLVLGARPIISKTRKIVRIFAKTVKNATHFVTENMLGIKVIKTLVSPEFITKNAKEYFESLYFLRIKLFLYRSIFGIFAEPLGVIFIVGLFALAYKSPGFNLVTFAVQIYFIQRILGHTKQLQSAIASIEEMVPYLQNVMYALDKAKVNKELDTGSRAFSFRKDIQFKNVTFAYDAHKSVLSDLSFSIPKGKVVGLIGPSGAGKTTIVDLLLRLLLPQKGEILIDGVRLEDIGLPLWRENVGYIAQDFYVVNDTFAYNIKFYNEKITDSEMVEAAKKSHIHDIIMSFPQGYQTVVGERGVFLSVGQRQRLIIARIFARKPKILILDEATSALDGEAELEIQKTVESVRGNITVFMIAHRLSTVLNCDTLLVLNEGRIVEEGSPRELLKNPDSYFYRMYNLREIDSLKT